jgi:ribosomal protein S18 acetylase RimI-like enzyme
VIDARLSGIATSDLAQVVAVHRAAFPRSALTKLGDEAVKRYYHWQLTGPHEMYASAAWIGTRMAGFCFGGIQPTCISGFLEQHKAYLASRVLTRPWLIANPMFRGRLQSGWRILSGVGRAKNQSRGPENGSPLHKTKSPYDVLSIAVHPELQGSGIGKALLLHAEEQARENGFNAMTLVVSCDNERAIRFYEHLGWHRAYQNGVWRGRMEKWLRSAAAPATA